MLYDVMVKQAYKLIDEIPQEKMEYVIALLKNVSSETKAETSAKIPERKFGALKHIPFKMSDDFDAPLDICIQTPYKRNLGCMKGAFKMSDDFDAPLEEFADYM